MEKNMTEEIARPRQAAEQGDALACLFLGFFCSLDEEVVKCIKVAYCGFSIADIGGVKGARKGRERLKIVLTPAALIEAQRKREEDSKKKPAFTF